MNNQHNPIAIRIGVLQELWKKKRREKADARAIRWIIDEPDLPLVNGFYKLESTPYGKTEEAWVVMLTDFESYSFFSHQLAGDWLHEYKRSLEKYPDLQWSEYQLLMNEYETLNKEDSTVSDPFLVKLFTSYKAYVGEEKFLLIGINPRKVISHEALSVWMLRLLKKLPESIGFVVTDYKNGNYFAPLFDGEHKNNMQTQTISLPNQDMQGAYTELMTQGNPNDPQVAFRKCMVKMSEATKKGNEEMLIKWGEKGLNITKNTKDLPFWASAHLIYAGFLFGFKDTERIKNLLDKGITIGGKQ